MSNASISPKRFAAGTAAFLRRAVTDQATLGALAPTFPALARRLAGLVPPSPGLRVLELGAGTGAISAAIGLRLGPGAQHLALERDPTLLAALEARAPWAMRIPGDAAELACHLRALQISEVDVVISSLPWTYFGPALQRRILGQVCSALTPDGMFATIACRPIRLNPRLRAFRALLDASFEDVIVTPTTWANLPPARVLVGHRPMTGPPAPH